MPVYVMVYLLLFFLFAFSTTYMHFEEGRGIPYIICEVISYILLASFIILCFYDKFYISALLILPMLIFTILWEFYSFRQDVMVAKTQFGIQGRELMMYSSIAMIFDLPPFLAGLSLVF